MSLSLDMRQAFSSAAWYVHYTMSQQTGKAERTSKTAKFEMGSCLGTASTIGQSLAQEEAVLLKFRL